MGCVALYDEFSLDMLFVPAVFSGDDVLTAPNDRTAKIRKGIAAKTTLSKTKGGYRAHIRGVATVQHPLANQPPNHLLN